MARKQKRARIAVPVRVSRWIAGNNGSTTASQMACTLDVTAEGARLNGIYSVQEPGEIIAIERGKNKALFRVIWVGARGTAQAGQLGVQCIEPDKRIWEVEFSYEEDEPYGPIKPAMLHAALPENDRNKRFMCTGHVELINGKNVNEPVHAQLSDISAAGCYVRLGTPFPSRSQVRMTLYIHTTEVHMKGVVGACDKDTGMWVEFSAIRNGDLENLQRALAQLAAKK
jgi:hypothetical protein